MVFGILVLSIPLLILAIIIGGAWMEGRRSPYPFGIGRVISNSFGAVGGAPLAFFGASFLVNGPAQLMAPFVRTGGAAAWMTIGIGVLFWLLVIPFLQLFMTGLALDTLAGRPANPRTSAAMAGRRFLSALALLILAGLGIGIGFLFLIVPGVILMLTWAVVTPVLAGEGRGVFDCFARSGELMRGMRWRLLLLLLIVFILWSLFAGLGQVVALAAGGAENVWVAAIVGAVTNTLTGALTATGAAAVFHEVRSAKEGMGSHDLEAVFA